MSAPFQIALIDDSSGDSFWLQIILREMNVNVLVACFTSGVEALELFAQNTPPDLIISD